MHHTIPGYQEEMSCLEQRRVIWLLEQLRRQVGEIPLQRNLLSYARFSQPFPTTGVVRFANCKVKAQDASCFVAIIDASYRRL